MAKAKQIKVKGIAQWVRVFEENKDNSGPYGDWDEFGGMYQLDMFLDEENEARLKKAGSAKKVKEPKDSDYDAEGNKFTFQRKHEGPFPEASGAPKVINVDGTAWDLDEDGLIGNGSEVEVTLTIYQTKHPKKPGQPGVPGTRLEKVKVLNHILYESDEPEYEEEEEVEEPVAEVEEKPKKGRKPKAEQSDEIPF